MRRRPYHHYIPINLGALTTIQRTMEGIDTTSLALFSSFSRLSVTISHETQPLANQTLTIQCAGTSSSRHGGRILSETECHRTKSFTRWFIPIDSFHSTGTNEGTTNPGLPKIEFLSISPTLQDGGDTGLTRTTGTRQLYGKDRLEGRLHSGPDSR
jgi:hypothetical protein